MAPYFIPLLLSVFAVGALSKKPGCDSTCYSGFTDIPGIASLCNNANRPTTTIEQSVTAYTTIVSTVTVSNYRYTDYHYTTPTPTKLASCGTPHALAAPLAAQTVSSGDLILTKVAAARPTAAALMPRNQKCQSCPPIKEGITSACSCFFTAGPQQTVTHNHTVATGTVYSTTTTTTFVYSVRTRTVAEGCRPTQVAVYGSASYAVCGSGGLPVGQYQECPLPRPSGNQSAPFSFDAEDCCSACANTLDCFQAYVDPASNVCNLDIRLASDGTNTNKTADCPNYHTWVNFADLIGYEGHGSYYSGFIAGHCHQSC